MSSDQDPVAVKAEIKRLRAKLSEIQDRDIRLALQTRIQELEASLPPEPAAAPAVPAATAEPEAPVEPPTPQQLAEAENLIRQARVERMRNNRQKATELMKQAAGAAPGSAPVLEALGDDLLERGQVREARAAYEKAVKLDPKNVGLERKYAETVLRTTSTMSVEDQLRMNLSDSLFLSSQDQVASSTAATILSVLAPGLGHIVVGKTVTGIAILVAWLIDCGWLAVMSKDLYGLFGFALGKSTKPNLLVLVPIFIAFAIWIGTLKSLSVPRAAAARKRVPRPAPPVDLPFD